VWHHAAFFGKLEGFKTLWGLAKEVELKLDELLLAESKLGQTALHMSPQNNLIEILEKLWAWTDVWQLNTNALKKKFLLAKDKKWYTLWHQAACCGKLEALETLWSSAKEVELNLDELLLAGTEQGQNCFAHCSTEKSYKKIT